MREGRGIGGVLKMRTNKRSILDYNESRGGRMAIKVAEDKAEGSL